MSDIPDMDIERREQVARTPHCRYFLLRGISACWEQSMTMTWAFAKINFSGTASPAKKRAAMIGLFSEAEPFRRQLRGTSYTYYLTDVLLLEEGARRLVVGYLNREPKTAHGREADESKQASKAARRNVVGLADSSVFIYDVVSCVFAWHKRGPFYPTSGMQLVLRRLLRPARVADTSDLGLLNIELLRDTGFVDARLDTQEKLQEIRLSFTRPNPGSGDDDLAEIDLGLIAEDTGSSRGRLELSNYGGGLDKSRNSFIRRSLNVLLTKGYLASGRLVLGGQIIDPKKAGPKERVTPSAGLTDDGQEMSLEEQAWLYFGHLLENTDVYAKVVENGAR